MDDTLIVTLLRIKLEVGSSSMEWTVKKIRYALLRVSYAVNIDLENKKLINFFINSNES